MAGFQNDIVGVKCRFWTFWLGALWYYAERGAKAGFRADIEKIWTVFEQTKKKENRKESQVVRIVSGIR
jgi:hypothetical protein